MNDRTFKKLNRSSSIKGINSTRTKYNRPASNTCFGNKDTLNINTPQKIINYDYNYNPNEYNYNRKSNQAATNKPSNYKNYKSNIDSNFYYSPKGQNNFDNYNTEAFQMTQRLICPGCYNRSMITSHEKEQQEKIRASHNPYMTSIVDSMKETNEKRMRDKIKERDKLTKKAIDSMSLFTNYKIEDLQDENCQASLNFFDKSEDHLRCRGLRTAKKKENIIKKNLNKFLTNKENPEIGRYYENCVGEGNSSIIKPEKSKYMGKYEYGRCIQNQIKQNEIIRKRKENEEKMNDNQLVKSQVNNYYRDCCEEKEKNYRNHKEMDDTNRNMIKFKSQKFKNDKLKNLEEENNIVNMDLQDKKSFMNKENNKKNYQQRVCQDYLNNYLRDKMYKEKCQAEEKVNDRKLKGLCMNCGDMGVCEMCRRSYPKNVLSPTQYRRKQKLKY